jgi:hypothetical protein
MSGFLLPPEWPFVRLWPKAYRCGLPAGLPPRNESPASWSFGKGNVASESVKTCKALSLSGNRVKSDFALRIGNFFLLFHFRLLPFYPLKPFERAQVPEKDGLPKLSQRPCLCLSIRS